MTAREQKDKDIARIMRAFLRRAPMDPHRTAALLYRIMHASVFASVPGKQNQKNAAPMVRTAMTATLRALRGA